MKKIVLSVLAIGAFAFTANAQTPDIKLGAKAGVNFSNLSNLNSNEDGIEISSSMKTGFHIGVLAEIFINEKFSIQPELLYSTQGAKNKISESDYGVAVNVNTFTKIDYINVPIMAKYYVIDGLSIQAGPQIGFLTSAKTKLDSFSISGTNANITDDDIKEAYGLNDDLKKDTKSVDFGVNFGAGYELPMGLFFDARYNLGLTKVNKGDNKVKNGVFQLSVGYKF
ncbi:MAG: PorT family protein [Flavobacteriaceae bacterium]|jgi:hypothetical protein|nr:PorT family protein [Flavobacteriaceae bacterium]